MFTGLRMVAGEIAKNDIIQEVAQYLFGVTPRKRSELIEA